MGIRKLLTAAMLATGIAAFSAGTAQATAISGSISMQGQTTAHTSTSITFNNPVDIGASTDSFAELGTCTGCVWMYSPFTSSSSLPLTLFTANNNGDSAVLDVTSYTFTSGAHGSLTVTGVGMVSLTGYTDTLASFVLTTQGSGLTTFSMQTVVPEPGTFALLAAGLLGCALFVGRRRRSMKTPV